MPAPAIPASPPQTRPHEIMADFLREVDQHLADLLAGRATEMYEVRDLAARLCIHPTHLSNTIKQATGYSPCYYFEARIMDAARELLRDTTRTVADIATQLTFDPSNFTKFFKRFAGCTPKQYRESVWAACRAEAAAAGAR
jgi:AraC-like DNA-binding protein